MATGLALLGTGQAVAVVPIKGVIVKGGTNPRGSIIGNATSDENGMFKFNKLEPGAYTFCFADDRGRGGSCAEAEVGEVCGMAEFDEERKATNRNYVGHVTLLR